MAVMVAEDGLDCRKCTKHAKIEHGFECDSPIPNKWSFDGWSTQRCPARQVTYQSRLYLDAYSMCKQHGLPNGNGWVNETKKLMEALSLIESSRKKDG